MRFLPALFSLALFSAAFLSFSIQPVLGKMLLPMVGGSPSGWIVAMCFFQLSLLAGYGISYGLGRLSPWKHAVGLLGLYAVGIIFLPPHLHPVSEEGNISLAVVIALMKTILVPFLALTATTAALQRVFSATKHPTANDPYYLFVASNLGSFAGLLIYPFLVEPYTGLKLQAVYWQGIYFAAITFIFICCYMAWKNRAPSTIFRTEQEASPLRLKQVMRWMILAFIPCSLSMGVTTLITTDLGGLPLFWVVPLGLYLLTFILAFSRKVLVSDKQIKLLHVIGVAFIVFVLGLGRGHQGISNIVLLGTIASALLAVFFVIAWSCHRMLAQDRPASKHLTSYYFIIALGGGLAGILHGFIIPFFLPLVIEFPIVVILSVFLLANEKPAHFRKIILAIFIAGFLSGALAAYLRYQDNDVNFITFYSIVFAVSVLIMVVYPRLLLVMGALSILISICLHYPGKVITQGRNFFGPYAVYDLERLDISIRFLIHGNTIHGAQEIHAYKKGPESTLGYYNPKNPIHDTLVAANAETAAVVGLGSGQMACYDSKVTIDFYEIDIDMQKVAEQYFTYLKDCPPRDIFIGDGRQMIAKSNRQYDVIMMDAFTSDAIPMHLLTVEAVQIYKQHLSASGIMLFHISNRHLKLGAPLAAIANTEGLRAFWKVYKPSKKETMSFASQWLAVPLNNAQADALMASGWKEITSKDLPWTDDWSSLIPAISVDTRL